MRVLAIVGSPRRERGISARIATRILAGATAAGAETELRYLVDEQPGYCTHCRHGCFDDLECVQEEGAGARSEAIEAADALVLCAPVYCWQPNGLTAALFDKARLSTGAWRDPPQHGKPAVGVAVAGNTGSGVFPALQSMYAWFCLWKYRPFDPVPATRFNLDLLLDGAEALGRDLALAPRRPFEGVGDLLVSYDALPYLRYGRADEFRWLASAIAAGLERRGASADLAAVMRATLDEAAARASAGDVLGAANSYIEAYRAGFKVW